MSPAYIIALMKYLESVSSVLAGDNQYDIAQVSSLRIGRDNLIQEIYLTFLFVWFIDFFI